MNESSRLFITFASWLMVNTKWMKKFRFAKFTKIVRALPKKHLGALKLAKIANFVDPKFLILVEISHKEANCASQYMRQRNTCEQID